MRFIQIIESEGDVAEELAGVRGYAAQAAGEEVVNVCADCYEAFAPRKPRLCKYALATDMWLGRWDPLFREANLSHQMLLALARVVSPHRL